MGDGGSGCVRTGWQSDDDGDSDLDEYFAADEDCAKSRTSDAVSVHSSCCCNPGIEFWKAYLVATPGQTIPFNRLDIGNEGIHISLIVLLDVSKRFAERAGRDWIKLEDREGISKYAQESLAPRPETR